MKKIDKLIKNESSVAFSIDGLDGRDVNKSAIYDFTIYFYDDNENCAEILFVKALDSLVTGKVLKKFLIQCLSHS